MQFFKLYQYNLRKIFTKSTRFWIVLVLVLSWWFLLPYFIFTFSKEQTVKEIKKIEAHVYSTESERQDIYNDNTLFINGKVKKISDLTYKDFVEWRFNCKEKRTALLKLIEDTNKEIILLSANPSVNEKQLKKKRKYRQDLQLLNTSNVAGIISLPFHGSLIDFFCRRPETSSSEFLKLINDISLWNFSGWLVGSYLLYFVIDFLFLRPKENSEEATILILTSPISRGKLFLSKVLATLTFFYFYCLLAFFLPLLIYYLWVGSSVSWGAFGLLTLWGAIVVPIAFFGLFLCPYLFFASWKRWIGTIFNLIITFFSTFWTLILYQLTPASWFLKLNNLENWFFQPGTFFGLGLLSAIIFLTLYYLRYQKEDIK